MRFRHSLFLLTSIPLVVACGALFNGGPQRLAVTSSPSVAEVWIDDARRGTTPFFVDLSKNKEHTFVFKHVGYDDATVNVTKKIKGTYVILDVLGGIVPVVIDAVAKTWFVLDRNEVRGELQPHTAMQGTLTDDEIAQIRLGVPADRFIHLPGVSRK
ncbi:MAG: PEGA domain-containing protein [Gemmatimonadaceae bacterium]